MAPPAHLFVDDGGGKRLAVTRTTTSRCSTAAPVDPDDVLAGSDDDALMAILGRASAVPFHRQPSTTSAAAGRQLTTAATYLPTEHIIHRARARSQRNMSSPWACCGLGLSTLALRGITSLVLLPSLIAGLVWVPALSVVWLCVVLVAVCAYEYAWIAFRIHYNCSRRSTGTSARRSQAKNRRKPRQQSSSRGDAATSLVRPATAALRSRALQSRAS
ncbi:hypothetical protein PINS_up019550 [Pythium insidiosum]|nr:hypothetical protein PINS_up019550 [Pythium insidiosum]